MRGRLVLGMLSAVLVVVPPAADDLFAQTLEVNDFEIALFGRPWRVISYFVEEDLMSNPNEDTFFEPEGLAFKSGVLYASGDREPEETDSRIAVYTYAPGGPLTFDSYIQTPTNGSNWWGPEGLTFNTSGSGYGGGVDQLVSVERDDTGEAGIIDLASGDVISKLAVATPEDITFLPVLGQFAALTDLGTSIEVTYYDTSLTPTGVSFAVAPGSNGLAAVSASFGSWLTGTSQTDEIFIVATKANPGNAMLAYDQAGNPIGPQWDLPVEPKARIPLGDWLWRILPAFGTAEAVAVDEANKVLFIGDEDNEMIHVLTPLVVADLDYDEDVDGDDFLTFSLCYNGSLRPPLSGCANSWADIDFDGDVDGDDFLTFSLCYNGSLNPSQCE